MRAAKLTFEEYLLSDDAARAKSWELTTLASIARCIGPVSQTTYERLRSVIAADVEETSSAQPVLAPAELGNDRQAR